MAQVIAGEIADGVPLRANRGDYASAQSQRLGYEKLTVTATLAAPVSKAFSVWCSRIVFSRGLKSPRAVRGAILR
jgi:hypothetical protein